MELIPPEITGSEYEKIRKSSRNTSGLEEAIVQGDEIREFIPLYPNHDDPKLQAKISAKQEFKELKGLPVQRIQPGQFYNHQIMCERYMRTYPRMLLFHEPGTGKTCTITKISEDSKIRKELDGNIRKCLILSPSESLSTEFKNQIVMKCTGGIYQTNVIKATTDLKERKRNITNRLQKDWYAFSTYITFYTGILSKFGEEGKLTESSWDRINDEYHNYMIACDEIHILQNERKGRLTNVYNFLKDFFRKVKNLQVILSTATPMINEFREITKIIDLLNDEDCEELRADDPELLAKMHKYLNGKVSYVRALDTGINLNYVGHPLDIEYKSIGIKSQLILYTGLMSPFQSLGYMKAFLDDTSSGRNKVWLNSRQASGFVYPDGTYGDQGFKNYFMSGKIKEDKKKKVYEKGDRFESKKLLDALQAGAKDKRGKVNFKIVLANLSKFSIKMYNTLRTVVLPGEKNPKGEKFPGARFEFFELIQSALAPFCIALRALGFRQFHETGEISKLIDSDSGKIIIEKAPRFGVITGKSDKTVVSNLLEILNHPENLHGEYIQFIIGSKATRISYNFYNIQTIDISEPWWNPSSIYQAISRGLRVTGHEAILDDLRKHDPNARLKINILKSVAIPIDIETAEKILEYLDGEKINDPDIEFIAGTYQDQDIKDLRKYKKLLDENKDELIKASTSEEFSEFETESSSEEASEGEIINPEEIENVDIVEKHIPPSRDLIMYEISEQKEIDIKKGDNSENYSI